jgi:hypothetical protein
VNRYFSRVAVAFVAAVTLCFAGNALAESRAVITTDTTIAVGGNAIAIHIDLGGLAQVNHPKPRVITRIVHDTVSVPVTTPSAPAVPVVPAAPVMPSKLDVFVHNDGLSWLPWALLLLAVLFAASLFRPTVVRIQKDDDSKKQPEGAKQPDGGKKPPEPVKPVAGVKGDEEKVPEAATGHLTYSGKLRPGERVVIDYTPTHSAPPPAATPTIPGAVAPTAAPAAPVAPGPTSGSGK